MIYRNSNLLSLAKEAPKCFCCGKPNDGTVVAAHSNTQAMGKGMGHKSADIPAFVCHDCHNEIDGRTGKLRREEAWHQWCASAVLSMRWALENHPEVFCKRKE